MDSPPWEEAPYQPLEATPHSESEPVQPPEPPSGDTTLASLSPSITAREPIHAESSPDNHGLSLAENDGFIVPPAASIPPRPSRR